MAIAKNPGIGQGKGGGRPRRDDFVDVRIRLSPKAAALAQGHADAEGIPLWKVFERLALAGLAGEVPTPAPELPMVALEITQAALSYLARHDDRRPLASRLLRKAWERALLIAEHDITG